MSHDSLHLVALEDEAITETGLISASRRPWRTSSTRARPMHSPGWARIASQKADASCACWCRMRSASR